MKKSSLLRVVCAGATAFVACTDNASTRVKGEAKPRFAQASKTLVAQKPLKITPMFVQRDDSDELLGVMKWNFDIQLPHPKRDLEFVVELREKGKAAQRIIGPSHYAGLPQPLSGHLTIFVGTYPLTGELSDSEQAKYLVRINEHRISKVSTVGSNTSSAVVANAFKGVKWTDSSSLPIQRNDGSFVRISGYRNDSSYRLPADVELVLTVKQS